MESAEASPLSRAVRALAETAFLRSGRRPRPSPADPAQLARLAQEHRLPAVYAEYLRAHSSRDLFDIGLQCGGVSCSLHDADGFADVQVAYTGQDGWPEAWIVVAIDYEACYVLDRDTVRDGDGAVYRVDHSTGNAAIPVAPSFVTFLERVAADSLPLDPPDAHSEAPGAAAAPLLGEFTLRDHLLGLALIAGVIAFSFALVIGALVLLGWLLRGCAG